MAAMLQAFNLDPKAIRQQFDRRAAGFERNDYLLREVERRMFERLDVVKIAPEKMIDLGCGLGAGVLELARRYPKAEASGVDLSPQMIAHAMKSLVPAKDSLFSKFLKSMGSQQQPRLGFEVADLANLPCAPDSVDLLWSNLVLHWLGQPEPALQEMYRIAKPGALLMFSAFGVDTLQELRPAGHASRAAPNTPVELMRFRDMHDWGDALVEVGFAEPVMDMERITLSFSEPKNLLRDLHGLGGNALADRCPSLSPRSLTDDLILKVSEMAQAGRQLTLTFEIIYGHAWVPARKKRSDGLATIEFLAKRP